MALMEEYLYSYMWGVIIIIVVPPTFTNLAYVLWNSYEH